MNCIHEEARQFGIAELTSNVSKAAEEFFLRHGFHVVERGYSCPSWRDTTKCTDAEIFGETIESWLKRSIDLFA
jgi:N-acetylglutamate synthase-like GNAT family acetyltransferase